jgi:hypothetical protein
LDPATFAKETVDRQAARVWWGVRSELDRVNVSTKELYLAKRSFGIRVTVTTSKTAADMFVLKKILDGVMCGLHRFEPVNHLAINRLTRKLAADPNLNSLGISEMEINHKLDLQSQWPSVLGPRNFIRDGRSPQFDPDECHCEMGELRLDYRPDANMMKPELKIEVLTEA